MPAIRHGIMFRYKDLSRACKERGGMVSAFEGWGMPRSESAGGQMKFNITRSVKNRKIELPLTH